jgi:hypothetical protein
MDCDIFGNFREWGQVPEQLTALREAGKLDEHQEGLVRMLRYRDNWRLREMALQAVGGLTTPSQEIVSEVLAITVDEELYYEVRILASQTLAGLLARKDVDFAGDRCAVLRHVVEAMQRILAAPGIPALHNALRTCLATIGSSA